MMGTRGGKRTRSDEGSQCEGRGSATRRERRVFCLAQRQWSEMEMERWRCTWSVEPE